MSAPDFWLSVVACAVWSGIAWLFSTIFRLRRSKLPSFESVPVKFWGLILLLQACGWLVFCLGFRLPPEAGVHETRLAFFTFPVATTAFCILVFSAERRLSAGSRNEVPEQ